MDRRLDFIIINETAYLLVLQLYMQRFSFYQFQIYKIQIGYICNELELNNPDLNHKNHFAKVQYLNFFILIYHCIKLYTSVCYLSIPSDKC